MRSEELYDHFHEVDAKLYLIFVMEMLVSLSMVS